MGLAWLLLAVAVTVEVFATAMLPRARGFTDPGWSVAVLAAYGVAIYLLTVIVQRIPVSVTYAIWAGLGTAAVAVVGVVALGEQLSVAKVAGLALIVTGVVVLNLSGSHTA